MNNTVFSKEYSLTNKNKLDRVYIMSKDEFVTKVLSDSQTITLASTESTQHENTNLRWRKAVVKRS